MSNPVTLKELRVGLRERRIFILQVLFLVVLLGFTLLTLPQMQRGPGISAERLSEAGTEFFNVLFWVQLVMLLFTMPALTCGSLSSERERHTLDMLMATRLSSGDLVAGKLGFALYCQTLLLFSTLPLAAVAFFLGGVSWSEALVAYVMLFLFGSTAASLGLFYSARESRSNYATAQVYLLMLLCSMSLPLYGALRYEVNHPVTRGFWQLSADQFVGGVLLYCLAFLFVKSRHRLRPEARNLAAMALLFWLLYMFAQVWYLALAWDDLSAGRPPGALPLFLWLHLVAVGFFLNPPTLDRRSEQQCHARRFWSRPAFWLIALGLGLWSPVAAGAGDLRTICACAGASAWLLLFPLHIYLLQRLLRPRWSYGVSFFLGLALLMFVPMLGAVGREENPLSFLSPVLAFNEVTRGGVSARPVLSSSLLTEVVVLPGLLLLGAARRRRRKQPA